MDEKNAAGGAREHGVSVERRQHAVITGVEDVACFNEQLVVLATSMGKMTISGEDMRVSSLNLSDGRVVLDGQIVSLAYDDRPRASKQPFLKRLFR